jgi:hypothetical protein
MLGPLPRPRFDTAYVETRRVNVAIPQIERRVIHYSIPTTSRTRSIETSPLGKCPRCLDDMLSTM